MKAVLQRVSSASVVVDSETVGAIGQGLIVLVGYGNGDSEESNQLFLKKVPHLRIFSDEAGKFQYSLKDIEGELLLVSQFTLLADCRKGRRPDFGNSLNPKDAESLFDSLVSQCRSELGEEKVATGVFGASMQVSLCNEGPVTLSLEF